MPPADQNSKIQEAISIAKDLGKIFGWIALATLCIVVVGSIAVFLMILPRLSDNVRVSHKGEAVESFQVDEGSCGSATVVVDQTGVFVTAFCRASPGQRTFIAICKDRTIPPVSAVTTIGDGEWQGFDFDDKTCKKSDTTR
jgi:hypothetical protein